MNAPLILLIILFLLMAIIGGKRGVKSFFTLIFNFSVLFIMIYLISFGLNPLKITIIFSVLITIFTLFYVNGINIKTISSLLSVLLAIMITLLITYNIGTNANIQGFGSEQAETLQFLNIYVQLNFGRLVMCAVLIGLLGAIIDVSISIASSMYEIYKSDPGIKRQKLIVSGMNIGKDILGTMTNTLLFAYIGGFMTLIIYFNGLHYAFSDIINAKVFGTEVFQSISGGIGIILIIPITALITSGMLHSKFVAKSSRIYKKLFT